MQAKLREEYDRKIKTLKDTIQRETLLLKEMERDIAFKRRELHHARNALQSYSTMVCSTKFSLDKKIICFADMGVRTAATTIDIRC